VTIAGSASNAFVDGVGTNAGFFHPCGLFLTTTGDLFITDSSHHAIRKMNSAGRYFAQFPTFLSVHFMAHC
jgi:hypothetical protein